jgi:hypothetical protein
VSRVLVVAAGLFGVTAACATAEQSRPGGGNDVDASVHRSDAAVVMADASISTMDAPAGMDSGMTTSACTTSMTCPAAQLLGTISGDTGADEVSADGYQSAWYRVRVTEDDSDISGLTLIAGATLTLPASGGFDVYMYLNEDDDVIECIKLAGDASSSGNTKSVVAEWGEGFFSNGDDDSRSVTVEVRATGTTCSAGDSWHLDVWGN